ncbi:thermonuclease family protein [Alcaligenes parafaecalis]|uniref:Thermonuclease family protein n=1 Tax=Alcaligenes parafaecalis TaxID=171260 RepID=A0ABT3VNU2_9BURK|nr:thermonuclease family protein [Alcaligenes parafaecalis]MCX5464938.1 thermonuclease family protein [Alcaligenes parafaecalis]
MTVFSLSGFSSLTRHAAVCAGLTAVITAWTLPVQAQDFELTGRVVRVADGDTLTILGRDNKQQRVRLASIDAPETSKDSRRPGQPFAVASRRFLSDLVSGKQLTLSCYERDRHGRAVCDVPLDDGETANQKLVRAGMAMANREKRGRFLRDPRIDGLEREAKEDRVGIWSEPNPVPPWKWRYDCWQQGQC